MDILQQDIYIKTTVVQLIDSKYDPANNNEN